MTGTTAASPAAPVAQNALPWPAAQKGQQLGASFSTAVGTGAAQTILAPGSNVNGVIVRWAWVVNAAGQMSVYFDTTAPASATDYTKRRMLGAAVNAAIPAFTIRDMFLPAGVGIYAFGAAAGEYAIGFDIL